MTTDHRLSAKAQVEALDRDAARGCRAGPAATARRGVRSAVARHRRISHRRHTLPDVQRRPSAESRRRFPRRRARRPCSRTSAASSRLRASTHVRTRHRPRRDDQRLSGRVAAPDEDMSEETGPTSGAKGRARLEPPDLSERGGLKNGEPQRSDERLFMQLLAFGGCRDVQAVARHLASASGQWRACSTRT